MDVREEPGGTTASAGVLPRPAWGPLAVVAVGYAVLLTALSGRYGFHRDEPAAGERDRAAAGRR